jgi:phosphatidylserine/phosphatidylglycerophosphate/cardiolipin synthase-like enzyme
VARGYGKAFRRARRLIYFEDQYMWSPHIARLLATALKKNPELHIVVVVPRHPDVDGRFALPPNQVGRLEAIQVARKAAPDRVHVFDLENHAGTPIYVHAKVCVIDDVWACTGSANLNRRSWSHDSELSCAVLDDTTDEREPRDPAGLGDGARRYARDLRLRLMGEHLDREPGDDADLLDPEAAVAAVTGAADALDAWHRSGRVGPRPPGRLRPHRPEKLPVWTRAWAVPVYRIVYDPDGRSLCDRLYRRW